MRHDISYTHVSTVHVCWRGLYAHPNAYERQAWVIPQAARGLSQSLDVCDHFLPVVETRGPAAGVILLKPVSSLLPTVVDRAWPPSDRAKCTARWLRWQL